MKQYLYKDKYDDNEIKILTAGKLLEFFNKEVKRAKDLANFFKKSIYIPTLEEFIQQKIDVGFLSLLTQLKNQKQLFVIFLLWFINISCKKQKKFLTVFHGLILKKNLTMCIMRKSRTYMIRLIFQSLWRIYRLNIIDKSKHDLSILLNL